MIIIKKINDLTRFPIIFIIFTLKNKKKYAYVLLLIKKQNTPMNLRDRYIDPKEWTNVPVALNLCPFEPCCLYNLCLQKSGVTAES